MGWLKKTDYRYSQRETVPGQRCIEVWLSHVFLSGPAVAKVVSGSHMNPFLVELVVRCDHGCCIFQLIPIHYGSTPPPGRVSAGSDRRATCDRHTDLHPLWPQQCDGEVGDSVHKSSSSPGRVFRYGGSRLGLSHGSLRRVSQQWVSMLLVLIFTV
jgi:hypothetical protein